MAMMCVVELISSYEEDVSTGLDNRAPEKGS